MKPPLIGLLDGPLPPGWPGLEALAPFLSQTAPVPPETENPGARHAEALAASIAAHAPGARFRNAVIFGAKLTTGEAAMARALDWLMESPPDIILCSFGLHALGPEARARFEAAGRAAPLVAASPARGAPVFPASLPFALSVQGDARCAPGQWSHLGLPQARFGAHVVAARHRDIRGASAAAAHFCGHLARMLAERGSLHKALGALRSEAAFEGPERRTE